MAQKSIILSLITVMLGGFSDVFARYSATVWHINPPVFVVVSLLVSALVLLIVAGPGRLGLATIRQPHTWAYSLFMILMDIAETFAYVYITTTEANFLIRFSIIISLLIGWVFYRRALHKSDALGVLFVALGLYVIASGLDSDVKFIALFWVVMASVFISIRTVIAETHPQSNAALTVKDRCRVTGYVLMVTSFVFILFFMFGAWVKHGIGMDAALQPILAPMPGWDALFHAPSVVLGIIAGATLLPATMYYYFYATRVAKAEVFMIFTAFLPFFTLAAEAVFSLFGLLSISDISLPDLAGGLAIGTGALVMLRARFRRVSETSD